MRNNDMLTLTTLIIGIAISIAIGTAASNYSESETAKVALKEGYCSKMKGSTILWEKCNDKRTDTNKRTRF